MRRHRRKKMSSRDRANAPPQPEAEGWGEPRPRPRRRHSLRWAIFSVGLVLVIAWAIVAGSQLGGDPPSSSPP